MTAQYPFLTKHPRSSSTYNADEMIARIFGHTDYGTRVPADVESPWVEIDGVKVKYFTASEARVFWNKPVHVPRPRYFGNGNRPPPMVMRAIAQCPCCNKLVAASRINQHASIHVGRKGKEPR